MEDELQDVSDVVRDHRGDRLGCDLLVAGALGLVLPGLTGIQPRPTPLTAARLVVVMALAAITDLASDRFGPVIPNLVLGGMAAFVLWGRTAAVPLAVRGSTATS